MKRTSDIHRRRSPRPAGRTTAAGEGTARAVLIGLDSMQGLQAARVLHARGVPVIAFAKDPKNDACRTNVCEEIRFTDTRTEDLIPALETLGRSLDQKAVLFPCEDRNVQLVSRHRHHLEKWFHIALPPIEMVEMLMDKSRFYAYALDKGLPIPPTVFLRAREDLENARESLRFPVVLKPANSATRLWEKNCMVSAFKVADMAHLYDLYDRYHTFTDVLIVQEWIAGPDSNLYSCNCYFDQSGEAVVTFVARKVRQWPPHIGKSSFGIECRSDEVRDETIRLLRGVEYRGLGYVEFKRDDRYDTYFIVEPNVGRPTGRSSIAEAGGVELLYTMYCDMVGHPLPANREQRYQGAKWMHIRRDFQSALYYWSKRELTIREWARSWRGKKAFALFSLRDPGPFLSDLWRVGRTVLSATERKRRRHPISSEARWADPATSSDQVI